MKYAVLKIVNGTFSIDSEWNDCGTLWNEVTVKTATVEIIDNQGDVVQGYKEFITHNFEPEQ